MAEVGEFPLIARLAQHLPPYGADVLEGVGDDVAVTRLADGRLLLLTCDIQVAGIHFLPQVITPYQLGHKVAAINLSDIGAKGGQPRHFVLSLGLPPDTPVEELEAMYDGLRDECVPFGVDVVGGNCSRAPVLVVDAFLTGEVAEDRLLRRKGARAGDWVLVSGELGTSRAGLELVLQAERAKRVPEEIAQAALAAHLTPTPRVKEGQAIAAFGGATAMVDISDGLAADLGHICELSRVGVRLWAGDIPVAGAARHIAPLAGVDPLAWALGGGEDYELCFTARPGRAKALAAAVQAQTGTPVHVVGEVLPEAAGRWLRLPDGSEHPLAPSGWDHFAA
ncbi:MAG: thiamine-phosphate kinase [Thermoflexales bacterium]|nr:thiamine-phosphate kinase [Thermoflexales bacterium]